MSITLTTRAKHSLPIETVTAKGYPDWLKQQDSGAQAWIAASRFRGKAGSHLMIPGPKGNPVRVVVGVEGPEDIWSFGGLPRALPPGAYRLDPEPERQSATLAALGWALGGYRFERYKRSEEKLAELVWPKAVDRKALTRAAEATFLVRDLVNTPAGDLGPAELAEEAMAVAKAHGGKCKVTVGSKLLEKKYPAIHAVGRAAGKGREPRLIDLTWGEEGPLVVVVGKGVCFDTGGLDLKSAGGMKNMKKDMGGAAHALALAQMIMGAGLKLRLRVLVPAVENAVSGDAFHPLDVLDTRKGLTVEVGNTDAEGRLILCDALAEADRHKPDLMIDFATLTGAARVALGPDLPALFTRHDDLAEDFATAGARQQDPVWRLPLHTSYRKMLDSKIADINNVSDGGFAGAITAGLFLAEFVHESTLWAHIDLYAWNSSTRPGRPAGGEAMSLRAAYAVVEKRLGADARPKAKRQAKQAARKKRPAQ